MKTNIRWQRHFYHPSTPLGANGKRITASDEQRELSKSIAKEGMVLLKNDGVLPIRKGSRVALFGKAVFDYVKGGGGSGDVTVSYTTNLYDGFKKTGLVTIFEETADFYRENVAKQYKDGIEPGMTVEPELPEDLLNRAKSFTDTAVIAICRFSGEGWDRKSSYDHEDMYCPELDSDLVPKAKPVFERGDFYLSNAEKAMVDTVKANFKKVIVVLNVGGMVSSDWIKNDDEIGGALISWQGGLEGGSAAAELLLGLGNPCGKLTDTFAEKLEDYPSSYNFHAGDAYVEYTDDIFVGYRYFETIPGAAEKVVYPFGFGLSYTNFAIKPAGVLEGKENLIFDIFVSNTGAVAGKEVVQVYAAAPKGKLQKAAKVLVGFKKTGLLEPGETRTISIVVEKKSLASYDDEGLVAKSAWVLEKGEYNFFVGNSVADSRLVNYRMNLPEDKVLEQCTEALKPTRLTEVLQADGTMKKLTVDESKPVDWAPIERTDRDITDGYMPDGRPTKGLQLWNKKTMVRYKQLSEVAEGKITLDEFLAQLSDEDLMWLAGGVPNVGVANTCGFGNIPEYGIPPIMTADGPAGLRIRPECGVCTTAWPCSTLVACTWEPELAYAVGAGGAVEVRENNIAVWLTPAVNIHRSPLCGRNFEYYSEDPLLTGKMAAGMVRGIQSERVAATVKHFALNNKETNRRDSDSRVTERAAREIYLRAFEIIVKESAPWCIMTSYNIVNGCRPSENKALLEGILRGEWGFDGLVMTDWWNCGEHCLELAAGNDIKMARGFNCSLERGMKEGVISREDLLRSAKHLMNLILKLD